jgi:hypothetical protein
MSAITMFSEETGCLTKTTYHMECNFRVQVNNESYFIDVCYEETEFQDQPKFSQVTLINYKNVPINIRPEVTLLVRDYMMANGIKMENNFEETDDDKEKY